MSEWKDLENYAKIILEFDRAMKPSLSGGTKGEEDVVGYNTVVQCKYTASKSIHILKNDLERLLDAAKLLEKYPIFVSEAEVGKVISVPITDDSEGPTIEGLKLASLVFALEDLLLMIRRIKDQRTLQCFNNDIYRLKRRYRDIKDYVDTLMKRLDNAVQVKTDDLTTYDLFESGEHNGTEQGKAEKSPQDGE